MDYADFRTIPVSTGVLTNSVRTAKAPTRNQSVPEQPPTQPPVSGVPLTLSLSRDLEFMHHVITIHRQLPFQLNLTRHRPAVLPFRFYPNRKSVAARMTDVRTSSRPLNRPFVVSGNGITDCADSHAQKPTLTANRQDPKLAGRGSRGRSNCDRTRSGRPLPVQRTDRVIQFGPLLFTRPIPFYLAQSTHTSDSWLSAPVGDFKDNVLAKSVLLRDRPPREGPQAPLPIEADSKLRTLKPLPQLSAKPPKEHQRKSTQYLFHTGNAIRPWLSDPVDRDAPPK